MLRTHPTVVGRRLAPILLCLASTRAIGQTITVHGVAFDSLHARPLAGAFVSVVGTNFMATSDGKGRFTIDSVRPGTYVIAMQHDVLDSIGMSTMSRKVAITDGKETVQLWVPTFSTVWRAACPSSPPADSGLVFGTVRSSERGRLPESIKVSASWIELKGDKKSGIVEKHWRLETVADASGNYALCGVPLTTAVQLYATGDSSATPYIDRMPLKTTKIVRTDLVLGPKVTTNSPTGTVMGVVINEQGRPLENVVVTNDGVVEARTDVDGRFVLRNVPVGTQQIEARLIGLGPDAKPVDVTANDTVRITLKLMKVNVLDSVRVVSRMTVRQRLISEYTERARIGLGHFSDSTKIGQHALLMQAFDVFPGLHVIRPKGRGHTATDFSLTLGSGRSECLANLWIDGVPQVLGRGPDQSRLAELNPDEIAAIEVYDSELFTPPQFSRRGCGSVVVWTKRAWHG
jgi:hypothetical protein